ncbi:glycerate kinase [Limnofasciculus baicalensis]|uniref:Glycerate kinase n=1 Tax=Limnofasciculus baicalensis BBK-W-15 TaxID=2699891 RepID=A0AAE3GMF3_9CYAN|nr:glycerate kinase [Limnofasciculus baicalensis]MCP2727300.1 glycerate kinase [Limnofasciculus baicalensis BBK-W-15]
MTKSTKPLQQIINNLVKKNPLTTLEWQQLIADALIPPQRAKVFGITPENVEEMIKVRSRLCQAVYTNILTLPSFSHQISVSDPANILLSLWNLWLPLAIELAGSRQKLARPLIQGILGGQGTGKTTLSIVLRVILAKLGYRTISISIDDIYKTYQERQLLQKQDPQLIWRGPPGTHDVELGLQVLDQLLSPHQYKSIQVPRFDKSAYGGAGDRTEPEIIESADIVLFEGWFVGVQPIDSLIFDTLTLPPIETDSDRKFAQDTNERLKDYLPLWERLDRLMVLYPTDYRLSLQWRLEAEQETIATGKSGMTESQVHDFVNYFWKSLHPELFITPLTRNSNLADLVIEINPDHTPSQVYKPGDI